MYTVGSYPMGARMDLVFPIAGWKLDCINTATWPQVNCVQDCACTQAGMRCDAGRNMF